MNAGNPNKGLQADMTDETRITLELTALEAAQISILIAAGARAITGSPDAPLDSLRAVMGSVWPVLRLRQAVEAAAALAVTPDRLHS